MRREPAGNTSTHQVTVRHGGISRSKVGIDFDCGFKFSFSFPRGIGIALIPEVTTLQIGFARGRILGRAAMDGRVGQ